MTITTLLTSLLVFELTMLWGIYDLDGLEEFVDAFYGRLKEIVKGEF